MKDRIRSLLVVLGPLVLVDVFLTAAAGGDSLVCGFLILHNTVAALLGLIVFNNGSRKRDLASIDPRPGKLVRFPERRHRGTGRLDKAA